MSKYNYYYEIVNMYRMTGDNNYNLTSRLF